MPRASVVSNPSIAMQIGISVMHLGRFYTKSEWLTAMLAIQVGTGWQVERWRRACMG